MIDFRQALKAPDDNDLSEIEAGPDGNAVSVKVTLGRVCYNALVGGPVNEPGATVEEHAKRWMLATKVKHAGEIELASEEITILKNRVAKVYNRTLIAGQAILMLDPAMAGSIIMEKKKAA